jgi:hypothetical protein
LSETALCSPPRHNRYLGSCRSLRTFLSSHPSDDLSTGVRSTRVYHTRHLPPCRFLTVRRFTPPILCLFYFIQAPPMGFKEPVNLPSTQTDRIRRTSLVSSSSVESRPKTDPRTAVIHFVTFLVLPSLDAPGASDNLCLSKLRFQLFPTKRRLPDDLVRQRKRLQTDLLRQSCSDLMRFRHAPPSVRVPTSENAIFMERPGGIRRVPEGSSSSSTGPRFTEPARRCARKKQERTCVQSEDSTRGDRPCENRSPRQSLSDAPPPRASPRVQAPSE